MPRSYVYRCSHQLPGFYIYSCQKMRYKGEYSPSFLADPVIIQQFSLPSLIWYGLKETYDWFPLSSCVPLLERHRYACFSHPDHSLVEFPDEGQGKWLTVVARVLIGNLQADDPLLGQDYIDQILVVSGVTDNTISTKPITVCCHLLMLIWCISWFSWSLRRHPTGNTKIFAMRSWRVWMAWGWILGKK